MIFPVKHLQDLKIKAYEIEEILTRLLKVPNPVY